MEAAREEQYRIMEGKMDEYSKRTEDIMKQIKLNLTKSSLEKSEAAEKEMTLKYYKVLHDKKMEDLKCGAELNEVDLSEEAIEFRRKINASIELYFKNKKTKTDKDYLNSIFDQAEKWWKEEADIEYAHEWPGKRMDVKPVSSADDPCSTQNP